MTKINTDSWKEFRLSDLFVISRGKRLKKADHKVGNIPYYSASKENNGLTDMIANPLFIEQDAIICTTFGDSYFIEGKFTASDEITILKNPKLNKLNGLFICTLIKSALQKFDFTEKAFGTRISPTKIKLPVTQSGKPDWDYMENYIKNQFNKSKFNLEHIKQYINKQPLIVDIDSWKEFNVSDIFYTEELGKELQVPTGFYISKKDLIENGKTPRITVTGVNNGVYGYFDCKLKKEYRVYKNFISVSFLGSMFYQASEASLDMKVHCLKLLDKELNENIALFLIASLKASLHNATYADQISSTVLPYLKFKLPVTQSGKPDWDYMENYINQVKEKQIQKLDLIKKISNELV